MTSHASTPRSLSPQRASVRRRWGPRQLASLLKRDAAGRDAPRILLAGKLTALVSPGGGEVQMLRTRDELRRQKIDAQLWRPWEQRLAEFDLVHLFGSCPEHGEVVQAARRLGLPVVISPVAWFDLASLCREPWSWSRRMMACGKHLLRATVPCWPSWRRWLYQACDLLLPNSLAEARQIERLFGVPAQKIRAVPNGADERFAHADPRLFTQHVGQERFVLYAGRIEPRKNQLNFLRAMRGTDVAIVILGDCVPGHETYLAECRRIAGPRVSFVSHIEHGHALLASAYVACACLVLASWYETPGLVALEAGMSGTPLVLPRGGCAEEYFGPLATYVAPDNLREIQAHTLSALARPRSAELARHVRERYSWQAAALATREAYATLL